MLEEQKKSRDAAISLAEKLDIFVQINDEYPDLRRKGAACIAMDSMISLITEFTEFIIHESTKRGEWYVPLQHPPILTCGSRHLAGSVPREGLEFQQKL